MFAYQSYEQTEFKIPELTLKPYPLEHSISKFDITLIVTDQIDKGIDFQLEYSTELFNHKTIKRIIDGFKDITNQVIMNSNIKLKDISLKSQLEELEFDISNEDTEFSF